VTKTPLAPPLREADDPEYATNLRRATLASTVGGALDCDFALLRPRLCAQLLQLFSTNLHPAVGLVASNKHRYLGVAVTREFSAMIAGGLAGVLGAILIAAFDGSWVLRGVYTFVLAAITFGTTFIAPETQGRDLLQVEDALDDVRAGVLVTR
jgi:hypothetical protein